MLGDAHQSWGRIELRHLAALEAIDRTGSFHAAADLLGYSQSAVSGQVAALERLVGHTLVDRPGGRRRVSLTPAGHLLLEHAKGIEATINAARSDLDALISGHRRLRLGIFQSVAVSLLPGILPRLAAADQPVSVEIWERPDDEALMKLVERGDIDLTFVVLPLIRGPFAHQVLLDDAYRVLVAAESPLAAHEAVAVKELRRYELIDYRDTRPVHHAVPKLAPRLRPRVVARSDDTPTIHALVAAGVGIAILPELSIDPANPHVRSLPLKPPLPPRQIALAWHRERYLGQLELALTATTETIKARTRS